MDRVKLGYYGILFIFTVFVIATIFVIYLLVSMEPDTMQVSIDMRNETQFSNLGDEEYSNITELVESTKKLEQEVVDLRERVDNLQEKMKTLERKMMILQKLVDTYKKMVEELLRESKTSSDGNLSSIIEGPYFCYQDDCGKIAAEWVKRANRSIYFVTTTAPFSIEGHLVDAVKRNVSVFVIGNLGEYKWCDYNRYFSQLFFAFEHEGINTEINEFIEYNLMVIDEKVILVGNYGYDDKEDEDLLVIKDDNIAKRYSIEFKRLWMEYGESPDIKMHVSSGNLDFYIFPAADQEREINNWINRANKSIYIVSRSITYPPIPISTRDALVSATRRGVNVSILAYWTYDRRFSYCTPQDPYWQHDFMKNLIKNGVNGKMYNPLDNIYYSFIVIDGRIVLVTHYYIFSSDTIKDLIVIRDAGVVEKYIGEFERLWTEKHKTP